MFFVYLILEIISIIFICFYNKNRKKTKIYLFLSIFPFLFLLCTRSIHVGADYLNYARMYVRMYTGILTPFQSKWLGFGFQSLCSFLSFFVKDNFYIAYAIINSITLILFYKGILNKSSTIWLSLTIFYCFCLHFQIFNQFRQMLAIALTFYNYKNLTERNLFKYFFIGIGAGLIHNTAFIMLPIYFISNIKINKKIIILYIFAGILCFFGFNYIENLLSGTYYGQVYFGSKYDITTSSSIFNFFVRTIMLIFTLIYYKPLMDDNNDNKYLINLVVYCTIFQVCAIKSYIFARLTTYFFVYYIILIPNILNIAFTNEKNKKIIIFLLLIILVLYQYVYYNSSSGASGGNYGEFSFMWND